MQEKCTTNIKDVFLIFTTKLYDLFLKENIRIKDLLIWA